MTSFNDMALHSNLMRAIEAAGFTTPTPIQQEAIPVILTGRDLMASAQTGTGKTAAFVLPALQRLLTPSTQPGRGPRVLVLTPTRELATQVNDDIRKFSRFCRLTAGSVLGGVPYPPQIRLLQRPLDLLVATPGRLMDHMTMGRVDLSRLEVFVLDEADRMLDLGFIGEVRKLAALLPPDRQNLLFSATLEGRVLSIARELLQDPARIQLAANSQRHDNIAQRIHQADDADHKRRLLEHHLACHTMTQAVIFTATKRKADRLAKVLVQDGHHAAALHGDMRQNARRRTVDRMRQGSLRLLVATDVAARGLDIRGVSHVINYDLPMVPEDYIHRIGRTGRAGANGTAITLVGPEDWEKLTNIERMTGQPLPREIIPGLEPILPEPEQARPRHSHRQSRSPGSRGRFHPGRRFGRPSSGNQSRRGPRRSPVPR